MSSSRDRPGMLARARRLSGRGFVAVLGLYAVLLIPDRDPPPAKAADRRPFAWDRQLFWESLESSFDEARAARAGELEPRIAELRSSLEALAGLLELEDLTPGDPALERAETSVFELAPLVAANPASLEGYLTAIERLRRGVKRQSERWDMSSPAARERLHRLLHGSRAALEEVLLQAPPESAPALVLGTEEPSATPGIEVHGVRLHSGDVLVSRGAAPLSALIARGHDLPGVFSHVALLHVDEAGEAAAIEAHIERGVTVTTAEDYLADKKLRVLVLRPRSDLPQLVDHPLLPHEAASRALREARERHIPYDFAMDAGDHEAQFCSEVAAAAYEELGLRLWPGQSSISSPGIAGWLAAFGVRHFETQEPSDLEYDPQLRIVAEWRDHEALFQDHADAAVVDVLLEDAQAGKALEYDVALLPLARVLKTWSVFLELFGGVGPVPEGMSATAALQAQRFARDHATLRERLFELAEEFRREHGYRAPYWELVRLAREAQHELER